MDDKAINPWRVGVLLHDQDYSVCLTQLLSSNHIDAITLKIYRWNWVKKPHSIRLKINPYYDLDEELNRVEFRYLNKNYIDNIIIYIR